MTSTDLTLQLDPPKFTVDGNDEDIELWAFRLPVSFPINALKGVEVSTSGVTKVSANGKDYRIELGETEYTDSFRVLVPKDDGDERSGNESSSSDDDENEANDTRKLRKLVPLKRPFTKHFSILIDEPELSETQLAPQEGPPPKEKMRSAYSHVPQRSGLKRRWMPLGVANPLAGEPLKLPAQIVAGTNGKSRSNSVVSVTTKREPIAVKPETGIPESKRIKLDDTPAAETDDSSEDKKLSKSERKAKKAEKKAAKKAKKEAKKAKKASKKVKREES